MKIHALAAHPHIAVTAVHGLTGAPLAWGFLFLAGGGILWWHEHHWQRFTSWCFAVAAGCFTVAIPPLFDAIAAMTASGAGLTTLAILFGICVITFYLQAIRTHKKHRFLGWFRPKAKPDDGKVAEAAKALAPISRPNRHRRIGTPLVSMITGALFVVVVGGWRLLAKNAGKSAGSTLAALGHASKQVNNGQAAAAAHSGPVVYIFAVLAVVVAGFIMLRVERHRHPKPKNKGGAGRPAAPAGPGRPAIGG